MIAACAQAKDQLPATPALTPRLHQAATQFEAMLLKDLLKPLTEAENTWDDNTGQGGDPLRGFATDAVANSMASTGALGFAGQIEQALTSAKSGKTSPNGSSHDTTRR